MLPASLKEVIDEFEQSQPMREAVGAFTFTPYLNAKKMEGDEYRLYITPWEVDYYLMM